MDSMIVICYRAIVATVALLALAGCYYTQAARGQLQIMRQREPVAEVIASDTTTAELGARLRLVEQARQFSIGELGLPDNDSYRSYADLERDYVLWNIIAVPEFSLQPKTWCYPIVGCVSYRGYFSKDKAERLASKLRADGYDVAFGGVAAYSTLGKFDDPVLSTMMRWNDTQLIAVMFHELAHQILYIKDDTEFNESFATAVEEIALERWLESREQDDELRAWRERRELRSRFSALVAAARADLGVIYAQASDDAAKRQQKSARLGEFADAARDLHAAARATAPGWLEDELNNARLLATTLYHGRVAEFRELLEQCGNDLPCFYSAARMLADST